MRSWHAHDDGCQVGCCARQRSPAGAGPHPLLPPAWPPTCGSRCATTPHPCLLRVLQSYSSGPAVASSSQTNAKGRHARVLHRGCMHHAVRVAKSTHTWAQHEAPSGKAHMSPQKAACCMPPAFGRCQPLDTYRRTDVPHAKPAAQRSATHHPPFDPFDGRAGGQQQPAPAARLPCTTHEPTHQQRATGTAQVQVINGAGGRVS